MALVAAWLVPSSSAAAWPAPRVLPPLEAAAAVSRGGAARGAAGRPPPPQGWPPSCRRGPQARPPAAAPRALAPRAPAPGAASAPGAAALGAAAAAAARARRARRAPARGAGVRRVGTAGRRSAPAGAGAADPAGGASGPEDAASKPGEEAAEDAGRAPRGFRGRAAAWWRRNAKLDRKRLRQMGLMCVLSYGFVSNVNAMLLICASTYVAMSTTGASPLNSAAALKQFGITYGGLYLFSNLIRPLRMSLALAISPAFERFVKSIERRLGCKRWAAVALTVLLANVLGTFAILFGGLGLASAATGVPVSLARLGTLVKAGKAARTAAA